MPVNFTETPPKRTTTVRKPTVSSKPTVSPDTVRKDREDAVNGLFQITGMVCMAFGKWADAGAINTHGPGITAETVKLADQYESVGNSIDALAKVSPFAGLIAAVTPLVIQLAANHKLISETQASAMGATNPEALSQRMQVQANREAIRIQSQLMAEKRAMAEEMAEFEREMEAAKEHQYERETAAA